MRQGRGRAHGYLTGYPVTEAAAMCGPLTYIPGETHLANKDLIS
ncbi:hypothetical protein SAMN05877838_2947 [Hoeflea halophila]|uniref:Uncharacterized protein n=1 Tax=Hoeflea halophila TaxID=714899 RepID=A0A286IEF4_9HYPH|nr:hypothetical protein SAMN05877838_2947 [Hoeflea halophila]